MQANNTIFLIHNGQIVATFEPETLTKGEGETEKTVTTSPKRAMQRFLAAVAQDDTHELYDALLAGSLQYGSCHLRRVEVGSRTVISDAK